ncbi:MAG: CBM9, partial [uncultured Thermomicrobiales bacterium]
TTEIYTAAAFGPPQEIPHLFPVLIGRRRAKRTTFAALFEHRAGGRAVVETFQADGEGRYVVLLRIGGRIACDYSDHDASATIRQFDANGLSVAESRFEGSEGVATRAASEPPIALDAWFPNLSGPRLRARVAKADNARQDVEIVAGTQIRSVQVEREAVVDLPVDWGMLDPPLAVRVACGEAVAERALAPALAFLGRAYALGETDQVRRGERHWRGRDDLSARFRVDREGGLLRIRVGVTDDAVVCSGPVEHHYDYDSVQIYFDPRGDAAQADTSLTGIFGLVLIPNSADGEPARVFPIGPGRATKGSPAEASPSLEGVRLRSEIRDDGYDLHLELPLARLGRIPEPGDKVGFDLIVNDNDGSFRRAQQLVWTGAHGSRIWLRQDYHSPQRFGALVF